MRSVTERFDAGRGTGKERIRSKCIFAFEGYSTEVAYFRGLAENRSIAGIDDLIGICVLQREELDSGVSDPAGMLEILKANIEAMERGYHNISTFTELARNEVGKAVGIGRSDERMPVFVDRMKRLLGNIAEKDGAIKDIRSAMTVAVTLSEELFGKGVDFLVPEPETYDSDVDSVCVLIDRDRESHSPQSIDLFINACRDNGFEPYICNPCFEFWLLLHFDGIYELDRKALSNNPMVGDRRYTEVELDRIVSELNPEHHYDKTDLDPLIFIHRIGEAVEHSHSFCTEIKCLKHDVGTNLGTLFERIMKKRRKH